MEPLLKITTIPIAYELKIQSARLEQHRGTAEVEISRDKRGLRIQSKPIRLNIDSFESRSSVSPTLAQSIEQASEKGKSVAYEATAEFAKEGQLMLRAKIGEDITGQIISQKNQPSSAEFNIDFIPKALPKTTSSGPELIIQYEMDKLNFDWKISSGDFQFIPGDIQLVVTQRPDVNIEYIGDPIYVPPSVSPDYKGVDVRA